MGHKTDRIKRMLIIFILMLFLFAETTMAASNIFFSSSAKYKIMSLNSGKVLDVEDESGDNGAHVNQFEYRYQDNQKWYIHELSGNDAGYYRIVSANSGKCLDISGGSKDDGASLIQYECHNGDNQKFYFIPVDDSNSLFVIGCKHSGKVLNVPYASLENSVNIVQYNLVDYVMEQAPNEIWIISYAEYIGIRRPF